VEVLTPFLQSKLIVIYLCFLENGIMIWLRNDGFVYRNVFVSCHNEIPRKRKGPYVQISPVLRVHMRKIVIYLCFLENGIMIWLRNDGFVRALAIYHFSHMYTRKRKGPYVQISPVLRVHMRKMIYCQCPYETVVWF
jgi:uncharacterized membrane protein YobD (UPF0266 family)